MAPRVVKRHVRLPGGPATVLAGTRPGGVRPRVLRRAVPEHAEGRPHRGLRLSKMANC